jgi:hypothetical protein
MKLWNWLEMVWEPFTFSTDKNPLQEMVNELIKKWYSEEDINKLFNTSYKDLAFNNEDKQKLWCKNLTEVEEILWIDFDSIINKPKTAFENFIN